MYFNLVLPKLVQFNLKETKTEKYETCHSKHEFYNPTSKPPGSGRGVSSRSSHEFWIPINEHLCQHFAHFSSMKFWSFVKNE